MTPIARQMYDLHYFIFWICVVIFVAVFGVMFYSLFKHRKSRGPQGRPLPREHDRRDRLDGDPVPDPAVHGVSGDQDHPRDEGHDRAGADDQGHGQPVELELRLSAGRLRLLLQPRNAARADREPRAQGRALPARGGQPAGRAGRHEGARADHRRRRAARVVGARARRQAGRHSRLRPRLVVQGGEGRRLSRPVRRALRQGPRLHADRRRGEIEGRFREVGGGAEGEDASWPAAIPTRCGT